jgi:hypothetical protein
MGSRWWLVAMPAGLLAVGLIAGCGTAGARAPGVAASASGKPAAAAASSTSAAAQPVDTPSGTAAGTSGPICGHSMDPAAGLFLECSYPADIEACAMMSQGTQAQLIGTTPRMWDGTKLPLANQPTEPEDCTFVSIQSIAPTAQYERAQLYCGAFAHGQWVAMTGQSPMPGTNVYHVVNEAEFAEYEAFSADHQVEVTLDSGGSVSPSASLIVSALHGALAYVAAKGCSVA